MHFLLVHLLDRYVVCSDRSCNPAHIQGLVHCLRCVGHFTRICVLAGLQTLCSRTRGPVLVRRAGTGTGSRFGCSTRGSCGFPPPPGRILVGVHPVLLEVTLHVEQRDSRHPHFSQDGLGRRLIWPAQLFNSLHKVAMEIWGPTQATLGGHYYRAILRGRGHRHGSSRRGTVDETFRIGVVERRSGASQTGVESLLSVKDIVFVHRNISRGCPKLVCKYIPRRIHRG
mmetsp:Transcript_10823/g.27323  ORF Transcript_10823/g.27323 Transcript_10823/m.27323 type:complete len:227 (-) Transcript_10823:630-1310(-)